MVPEELEPSRKLGGDGLSWSLRATWHRESKHEEREYEFHRCRVTRSSTGTLLLREDTVDVRNLRLRIPVPSPGCCCTLHWSAAGGASAGSITEGLRRN